MESIYRTILKKSWELTKKYKWLWFFGLFTALLGNGGEVNTLIQSNKLANAPEYLMRWKEIITFFDVRLLLELFMERLSIAPMQTILALAAYLVLFLLIIWVITISQGALIDAIGSLNENKETNFRKALRSGQDKFWLVLGLNLITKFVIYFVLIVLALPFAVLYLLNTSQTAIVFITLLAFIILVPVGIIISFILKFALAYVVLKNQKTLPSFVLAWRLFVNNWLICIEMAIVLFMINVAVGLLLVIFIVLVSLPFLGLIVLIYLLQEVFFVNTVVALLLLIIAIPLMLVGATLATFQYGSWVLLFQKLQRGKIHPKLIRILQNNKANKKK